MAKAKGSKSKSLGGAGAKLARASLHGLLCTMGGVAIFMSFPNFLGVELFVFEWFALVPVLYVLRGASVRSALWWGWWTGFVVNAGGFYWITNLLQEFGHLPLWVAVMGCGAVAVYQGLVFALWAVGTVWLKRGCSVSFLVGAPVSMVLAEAVVPFLFPWYLANGQYKFLPIIQMVEFTGVAGLTFLIVLVNVALWSALEARLGQRPLPRLRLGSVGVLFALVLGFGLVRMEQIDQAIDKAEKVRVGLVEADVGIWEKQAKNVAPEMQPKLLLYNLIKHQRLSRAVEEQGAELIVWPESSYLPLQEVYLKRSDLFGVAVGADGTLYERRGDRWVVPSTTLPAGVASRRLLDVWAEAEDRVVAVGESGMLLIFDGRTWRRLPAGTTRDLISVTGRVSKSDGRLDLWLLAADSSVIYLRGEEPAQQESLPSAGGLRSLAYDRASRTVIAVGAGGQILVRSRKGRWRDESSSTDAALFDVSVTPTGDAFAVGSGGQILRRRQGGWRREAAPPGAALRAVAALSRRSVIAVGESGRIVRYDGRTWSAERGPGVARLTAVGLTIDGVAFATSATGEVIERVGDKGEWAVVDAPGHSALESVVAMGSSSHYPLPDDVAYFYNSARALPTGDDAAAAFESDRGVPIADRTALMRGFRSPVFFGGVLFEAEPPAHRYHHTYNVALLVEEDGRVAGRYDKNHLLLFGEYLPFGEMFPSLYDYVPEAGRFTAGTTPEVFDFRGYKLGPLICYEDILPRFARQVVARGAQVMINVTNDAWFGMTAEPYLHLALAIFRSVENRRYMVRATNTGVSAFVDANGRLLQQTSLEDEEVLVEDVPMLSIPTLYNRIGDAFTSLCLVIFALCLIHGFWPRARQKRRSRKH